MTKWYASGERIVLDLTEEHLASCVDVNGELCGDVWDSIQQMTQFPEIARQLEKIDPAELRQALQAYGAWTEVELSDHEENLQRILWHACQDLSEDKEDMAKSAAQRSQHDIIDVLLRFSRLYPHLHMEIHVQDDAGNFFEHPRIGYINDGVWVDNAEACAIGDMVAIDAIYLEALNYPTTCVSAAVERGDLDEAFRLVQEAALIRHGDVAGVYCSGEFGPDKLDAEGYWQQSAPEQRRAFLVSYLAFESLHLDNRQRKEYRRADASDIEG